MSRTQKEVSPLAQFTLQLFFFLILAGAFFYFIERMTRPPGRGELAAGEQAPAIKAAGWVNGEPPSDLRGKVVVIDAWATWCLPCKMEAPHLVETWKKFSDNEDVVFIGLTSEGKDSLPAINTFLKDVNVKWPNGYGATETLDALKAEYIPAVWVVNRKGIITWTFDSLPKLEDAIEEALKETE